MARLVDLPGAESLRSQWADHRRFVHHAEPGTAFYAPRPFPESPKAVEENFRYAYFEKLFDDGPEALAPSERFIYEGLRSGAVEVRIVRVENWGLSRCSPNREVPFFHLVRLFGADGRELARGSILPTGLLGRYVQFTEIGSDAVPDLDAVPARVEKILGRSLKADRVRYAAIDGLPLHCGPLVPCVVFEAGGSSFVLDRSALLFEIPTRARRVTVTDRRTEIEASGLQPLGRQIEEKLLITQGFEWVEARLIGRDEEMARSQRVQLPDKRE